MGAAMLGAALASSGLYFTLAPRRAQSA